MPKIYRVMKKDQDDKPVVDTSGKGLGVRTTPVNGISDVDLDEAGRVLRNAKGMSVVPNWRDLPIYLIPKRFDREGKFPGARCPHDVYCFSMGEGPFADGPLADGLDLKSDGAKHGLVVPRELVPLDRYQADLAATRDLWKRDED
jgi:hypothetical protein